MLVRILMTVILILAVAAPVIAKDEAKVSPKPGNTKLLKFASWLPPKGAPSEAFTWWFKELEKLTNGRVTIDLYWSGSLVPAREELAAINKGIADVAMVMPAYTVGRTPLWTVTNLPGIFTDMWAGAQAFRELAQIDVMKEELAKNKAMYLLTAGTPNYMLLSTKPVKSLNDFKGLKVDVRGDQARMVQSLGGVPVSMAAGEVYNAIEKGTIQGAFFAPIGHAIFKLYEVAKYYNPDFCLGGSGFFILMNTDTWNSLPPDIQQIIIKHAWAFDNVYYYAYVIQGNGDTLYNKFPQAGVKTLNLPDGDKEIIRQKGGAPIWDAWVKKMEGKGGDQILKTWLELVKKYESRSPYKALPLTW